MEIENTESVPQQVEEPTNEEPTNEGKLPKPKPAPPELGESILPMARVQKIMKADKDLPNVTKEAVHTISVATVRTTLYTISNLILPIAQEEFIKRLSAAAYTQASRERRTMIQYKDVGMSNSDRPGRILTD